MDKKRITRRQLLQRGTAASVGALSFPYIVPASVFGNADRPAPSERIVLGCVGVGGQGLAIMGRLMANPAIQVVAVCDVEEASDLYLGGGVCGRKTGVSRVNEHYAKQQGSGTFKGCDAYGDFRELVARKDIDAVTVCTPDHWHALISVAAAKAGKDIYCEKPLANTVADGRAICDAVKANRRILQTGSHERSNEKARFACELVRNGRIGRLHTIRVNLPVTDAHHKWVKEQLETPPEMPVPATFDYDMWLGPTPVVPYTAKRCHFWWRFNLAYGGGEMTDRGAHVIDLGQLGGGFDDTGPIELSAEGKANKSGLYDTFMEFSFDCTYANGVRMIGTNDEPRGVKFEGDKGWIFINVHGGKLEAEPKSLLDEKIGDNEIHLGRTPNHTDNFVEMVKSRGTPMATAEIGHRTGSICHLLNIAMLTGSKLKWDPKAEQITNDAEANKMLARPMRSPWKF